VPLTPIDIHNKEFTRGFRGYDEDEVNEFLDQIIKNYEMVIRQKKELEQEVSELNERLSHYSNIEETLNKSIEVAKQTAEEVKTNANKESSLIIKEAENDASRIVNEAVEKSRRISSEVETMKKQAKFFKIRVRKLVEAQMEMIDHEGWEDMFETELDGNETLEEAIDKELTPNQNRS